MHFSVITRILPFLEVLLLCREATVYSRATWTILWKIVIFLGYSYTFKLEQTITHTRTHTHTQIFWRCLWCNGHYRRKWTWRYEIKSWRKLMAFHITSQVQILDKTVCISHSTNTLGKSKNPTIRPFIMSRGDWLFNLGLATSLGEGKRCIQTC